MRFLFSRKQRQEELHEEIGSHLEMAVREHLERGEDAAEARAAALREFGNATLVREVTHDQWGWMWLENLFQDLRFGLRMLRKSLGFTIVAILTLALGIGATSAVFSVVDRILFRSLPYPHDDRLVSFGLKAPLDANEFMLAMDYVEWRKLAPPFAEMASMVPGVREYDFTEQNPARVTFAQVDSHFLPTFGNQPALGRNFSPEDCLPHAPHVALLSYGLWRSRYGGDPNIVGRSVSLNEQPTRIVGVLPADFEMPTLTRADLLIPETLDEARMRRDQPQLVLRTFARMKPGVTVAQSRAALQPLFEHAMKFLPPSFRDEVHLSVRSLRERQMETQNWHPGCCYWQCLPSCC